MEIHHPCMLGLVGLHLNTCKPSYARSYSKARPCDPPHTIGVPLSDFQNRHQFFFLLLLRLLLICFDEEDASLDHYDLKRARMKMTRVCVYHVGQKYASDSPGIVGECLAVMAFECARYQFDVFAGDGNKACYYTKPKSPGGPTYQHSLSQFWINRIMGAATQAMGRNYDSTCPPVRVKHFISCSYHDLDFLATHLDGIKTVSYTEELMKKTTGKGDCSMLTVVEWGIHV